MRDARADPTEPRKILDGMDSPAAPGEEAEGERRRTSRQGQLFGTGPWGWRFQHLSEGPKVQAPHPVTPLVSPKPWISVLGGLLQAAARWHDSQGLNRELEAASVSREGG